MPRRKLKIISIAALVAACFAGYFGFREYSERKFDHTPRMVKFFKANRANLEELAKMATTEPKILRVDLVQQHPSGTLVTYANLHRITI
ncbi:hypothetical protein GURASL_34870 [Geotalea uraniireducens]|uniref:Uncharacterized protein n=1 Tax=Geotalea uraniireducens TaxID=351604 RepID=A0ABM8ER34_9BACT|nr:hypothetical protein GURASL_34870 [Geotalea uraniireducens]